MAKSCILFPILQLKYLCFQSALHCLVFRFNVWCASAAKPAFIRTWFLSTVKTFPHVLGAVSCSTLNYGKQTLEFIVNRLIVTDTATVRTATLCSVWGLFHSARPFSEILSNPHTWEWGADEDRQQWFLECFLMLSFWPSSSQLPLLDQCPHPPSLPPSDCLVRFLSYEYIDLTVHQKHSNQSSATACKP